MENLILWVFGNLLWLFAIVLWIGGAWCLIRTVIRVPEILLCCHAQHTSTNVLRIIFHWAILLVGMSLYFSTTLFDVLLLSWVLGVWTWAWLWLGALYVLTFIWARFLWQQAGRPESAIGSSE